MNVPTDRDQDRTNERVHYFSRQLITADDMTAEQDYFREKLRRHNRMLHGWGVVWGCAVTPLQSDNTLHSDKGPRSNASSWMVSIGAGYVITPGGDEILLPDQTFDLAGDWRQAYDPCPQVSPCPPTLARAAEESSNIVYLAVCYTECATRPVRIHPPGCGCDGAACEYSRIRDSFELVRLRDLPESHKIAKKDAKQVTTEWQTQYQLWINDKTETRRVFPCPDHYEDNCVVLARIVLPKERSTPISAGDIH